MEHNDKDLDTMARTMWAEARGDLGPGEEAVGFVIAHRAERHWAGDLLGKPGAVDRVCREPWQFSCWNVDDPNLPQLEALTEAQLEPVKDVCDRILNGVDQDPTGGADHYYAMGSPVPSWASAYAETAHIGHHLFFNSQAKVAAAPLAVGLLSKNFTLAELVESQVARDLGIKNDPTPVDVVNLRQLVENVLQPARDLLAHPMIVSSGYRSRALNNSPSVKGALNSDHMIGCAADFRCPDFGMPEKIVKAIAVSAIPFKQLIFEHPYGLDGAWVHISWAPGEPKREVLECAAPGVYVPYGASA